MIKAGEFVTCPECGRRLLKVLFDIEKGDIIHASYFKAVADYPAPVDGQMVSEHCGVQPIQSVAHFDWHPLGMKIHVGGEWRDGS